jgi:molybdenum cofactor cytidylyltransferase
MASLPAISPGIVLLAAGASSRMGQPKLLLPWGETSVLGHLLQTWTVLGARQIAAVIAVTNTALGTELNRLQFPDGNRISNPQPERGMFSSIQCAARWRGWRDELTHFVIVLGDQPHLRRDTLQSVLDFAAHHPADVVQPSHHGRGRHPVILPRPIFTTLATSPHENLKSFLQDREMGTTRVELSDPGLDLDIDSPADYEKARLLSNQ